MSTILHDNQGQPVLDGHGQHVLTGEPAPHHTSPFRADGIIPLTPDANDPAYKAYLQSLDKNGDGALDKEELRSFIDAIDAAFRERSQTSLRIKTFCSLAPTVSVGGKLSPEALQQVESGNKNRAYQMVEDYLETDTAKEVFKNGIAQVNDEDLAPIVKYALDFAKACAAKSLL